MTHIVVVGGGISGLAAAWTLSQALPDARITVLEAAPQIGGKLQVASVGGVQVDVGAEALLARRPEGIDLIRAVGLDAERMTPTTTSATLRVGGARHPLPVKTIFGIPGDVAALRASGALTASAIARVAAEAASSPGGDPVDDDVAVGELVRARLGNEVVDRLVEPLLGGVYAGRADELSLRATMPALAAQLELDGSSLVRAAAAIADAGAHDPGAGPVFTSLRGGLGELPAVLARRGSFSVRTGATVRSLRRTPDGYALECGAVPATELIEADAVVLATPAAKTALLLREVAPAAAKDLQAIESASVAIVTLAFRGVALPPGSGVLVGIREGYTVKAVTASTQKWPIDSGDLTIVRASIGRAGDAAALQRDDASLVAVARHELRSLIDVDADPVDTLVTRWGGGLPQYAVGHVELVQRVRSAVALAPGLAVCGAAYDGVGIPACIASAQAASAQIVAALAAKGQ